MGLHYAVRIFVGTSAVWLLLRLVGDANPIWAVISVIVVTEPDLRAAWLMLGSRVVNTAIGCITGVLFLLLAGPQSWVLPLALTTTVLVCIYVAKLSSGWRLAPATAALIIASAVAEQSRTSGAVIALQRAGEVVLGCVAAFLTTLCLSKIWAPRVAQTEDSHSP
jgi:uncharacterized membrane protein YccC